MYVVSVLVNESTSEEGQWLQLPLAQTQSKLYSGRRGGTGVPTMALIESYEAQYTPAHPRAHA
jgi:hypothetical protein